MTSRQSGSYPLGAAVLMGMFYFFYFALVGVYIIFLPKMLTNVGFSATEVGIVYAAAPFMRFLLPFIFRHWIRLDRKAYTLSLLFMALSSLLFFATADNFAAYLIANLLFGASMGVALPYVETIALQVITKVHYGKVRLWGSIGFMVIAIWLGKILTSLNQGLVYLNAMALATLIVGYFVSQYDTQPTQTGQIKEENRGFSLTRYWAFWLSAFFLQVSFGGFYNFFTIYETQYGISLETTSYLWSFGVICEIIMLYFQGPLLKRNLLTLLKFSIATAVVRWAMLYYYPDSLAVAYASQSLHAFSFALYYTAVIAYVFDLYTQKKLAQQFLLGMTFGLGGSVGAVLAGWIYDINSEVLFGFETLMALLSLGAILLHEKRRGYCDVAH